MTPMEAWKIIQPQLNIYSEEANTAYVMAYYALNFQQEILDGQIKEKGGTNNE